MRKIHAAYLAGAVVVGLGAVAGVAAYAPSLFGQKPVTHELTLQLPGGSTETIAYTGEAAPKITFHTRFVADWPEPHGWAGPSFVTFDPLLADMTRHFHMLASLPLLMPSVADQPLTAATIGNGPSAITSVVSETVGKGVCTRFTQITKAADDAKPRIVSQSSGNCEAGSTGSSQPTQVAKAANLRTTTGQAVVRNM